MSNKKKERRAPLKIQFGKGYQCFRHMEFRNPYKEDIQRKEWQRGWDAAYFNALERARVREARRNPPS